MPQIKLSYDIDRDLIAIGTTTWQTKNITAVIIDQKRLEISEPKPKFLEAQPEQKTRWGIAALAFALVWTFAITTEHPGPVGWLLTAGLVGGIWALRRQSYLEQCRAWSRRKNRISMLASAWE